ncbi:MAG: anion permease [Planctomycetota bacterium]
MIVVLTLAVASLAWANGANDNFKGVATLYGSRTVSFMTARYWATLTTAAGGLASLWIANGLAQSFSGGVIGTGFRTDATLISTALAGGATVMLATRLGMPASTTHALLGAWVGSAIVTSSEAIDWSLLMTRFAKPLVVSPLLSMLLAGGLYWVLSRVRRRMRISGETCVCVGSSAVALVPAGALARDSSSAAEMDLCVADTAQCVQNYRGQFFGVRAQSIVNAAHFLASGAVCLARGSNDTPKVAALLIGAGLFAEFSSLSLLTWVVAPMLFGGWLESHRVARTMGRHITTMNTGQGLTANLVAAFLVLSASTMGLPVSTTHVVCGAIFGIAMVNRQADLRVVSQIVTTWVTTLPLGFLLGAACSGVIAA